MWRERRAGGKPDAAKVRRIHHNLCGSHAKLPLNSSALSFSGVGDIHAELEQPKRFRVIGLLIKHRADISLGICPASE